VAKLLVADDNSNIQKMVALALKDQGIEVVAVGNGEAAVRKIPEFQPDVVLADVFMPVRNGYEVCEFIKKNDKLSHIPVILLVGAFDPLDEQEAQRVGADGVLKKPFVPPDPLISMVKSALARTGADKAARAVPVAVGVSSSAAPVISSIPAVAPSEFAAPEVSPGPPLRAAEEAPVRPQAFSIEEGHSPLAFGSLLGPATAEKQEEADESFMPAARSGLADEHSWNTPAAEEEEGEPEEIPSWRSGVDDAFDSPAAPSTNRVSDWRDTVPSAPQGSLPAVEASPTVEATAPAEKPQSAFGSAFTESPFGHRQNEQTPVSAEPEPVEAEPFPPPSSFTPENYPGLFVEEKAVLTAPPPETTEEPSVEQEFTPPAGPRSNWEEEVRRAARMVTAWETAPEARQPEAQAEAPAFSSFDPPAGDGSAIPSHEAQWPSHPPAANDPAPAGQFDPPDWYRKFQATPTQAEQQETAPAPTAAETAQAPDMDALVAKVLEKMSPSVLQQVTRDILKPMVEALVRDELDKKK
jgi:CheY-like chemotaxis protein